MTVRRIKPNLPSADFERSRAFYRGVIGLDGGDALGDDGHRCAQVSSAGVPRRAACRQRTRTRVPILMSPLFRRKSIAGMLTRTQPCEAAWAGTDCRPWTAIPPLKYIGAYSSPSG